MTINVIHLPERTDRFRQMIKEFNTQEADYRIWNGIIDPMFPFKGICQAHKQIVRSAQRMGLKRVCIAEDDILFTDKNSYKYFLSQIPEDYDIFFGMIYEGRTEDGVIKGYWCGMTMYVVHERFYDRFLAIKEHDNIDRRLSIQEPTAKFIVCEPMVCYQSDGWSDNKKEDATYWHLLKGKELYTGSPKV